MITSEIYVNILIDALPLVERIQNVCKSISSAGVLELIQPRRFIMGLPIN